MVNLKGLIFGLAIFILTLFVTIYGVNSVYPQPKYENFCSNGYFDTTEMNQTSCEDSGGRWNGDAKGYCDVNYECSKDYEEQNGRYSLNIFLICLPLGILILFFGFYFFSSESVGAGLMLGGVGTIVRGIGEYWRYSGDFIRFLISLIGLIVVIYFSYKFQGKFDKPVKKKVKKKRV